MARAERPRINSRRDRTAPGLHVTIPTDALRRRSGAVAVGTAGASHARRGIGIITAKKMVLAVGRITRAQTDIGCHAQDQDLCADSGANVACDTSPVICLYR